MGDLPPTMAGAGGQRRRADSPSSGTVGGEHAEADTGWREKAREFVFRELCLAEERGEAAGREKILEAARREHMPLSQKEVRDILREIVPGRPGQGGPGPGRQPGDPGRLGEVERGFEMTILEKLEAMEDFTYVERKIARYILEHKDDVGEMTISGLAAAAYSSNAAIIRLCRKLGAGGYREFRIQLVRDIERHQREQLPVDMNQPFYKKDSASDIVKQISDLMTETIHTCHESMPVRQLERAGGMADEGQRHLHLRRGGFHDQRPGLRQPADQTEEAGGDHQPVRGERHLSPQRGKDDAVLVISYSGHNVLKRGELLALRKGGAGRSSSPPWKG